MKLFQSAIGSIAMMYCCFTHAQTDTSTKGMLRGQIADKKTFEPIPYVDVNLSGMGFRAVCDVNGNFTFVNIPVGR